jgi:hypothetical protein
VKARIKLYVILSLVAIVSAACAGPEQEATATPVPIQADPAGVVEDFWNAFAAKDLDLAMSFVAEDFKCRGSCYFGGKDSLRLFLQGYLDGGFETMISDLQVEGDMVSYKVEVHRNGLLTSQGFSDESMQVRDGLIVFWENLRP